MTPGQRKRPPFVSGIVICRQPGNRELLLQGNKKQRRTLDPPGVHLQHSYETTPVLPHVASSQAKGKSVSRPGSRAYQPKSRRNLASLQKQGQTNEEAINIDSDDSDIEVVPVGSVLGSTVARANPNPSQPSTTPRKGWLKSVGSFPAYGHPSLSTRSFAPAPDATVSSSSQAAQRPPQIANSSSSNSDRRVTAHYSRPLTASANSTKNDYGNEDNPIEIIDVDTEEDFANMEDEVEVINIEDSDDDDDDEEFQTYLQSLQSIGKCKSPLESGKSSDLIPSQGLSGIDIGFAKPAKASSPFRNRDPQYAPQGRHYYRGRINSSQQSEEPVDDRKLPASKKSSRSPSLADGNATDDDEIEVVQVTKPKRGSKAKGEEMGSGSLSTGPDNGSKGHRRSKKGRLKIDGKPHSSPDSVDSGSDSDGSKYLG